MNSSRNYKNSTARAPKIGRRCDCWHGFLLYQLPNFWRDVLMRSLDLDSSIYIYSLSGFNKIKTSQLKESTEKLPSLGPNVYIVIIQVHNGFGKCVCMQGTFVYWQKTKDWFSALPRAMVNHVFLSLITPPCENFMSVFSSSLLFLCHRLKF